MSSHICDGLRMRPGYSPSSEWAARGTRTLVDPRKL